jgi:hypothetical protein
MPAIYDLFKASLDPIVFILILIAFGIIISFKSKKKHSIKIVLLAVFSILYIASISPVSNALSYVLEKKYLLKGNDDVDNLDVVVVLGGGVTDNKYLKETIIKGTVLFFILQVNKFCKRRSITHQATSSSLNLSIRERTGFNSVIVTYTMGVSFSAILFAVSLVQLLNSSSSSTCITMRALFGILSANLGCSRIYLSNSLTSMLFFSTNLFLPIMENLLLEIFLCKPPSFR